MVFPLEDIRIRKVRPLIPATVVREHCPLPDGAARLVVQTREAIANMLKGADPRLLTVVGPCSIHDGRAALEYAERLAAVAERLRDRLVVVMRAYFEKPRTVVGWKGFINDPDLNSRYRINDGLLRARQLLAAINALGLPTGSEVLDLHVPQYIGDLTSWVSIGARTSESQIHRELASGLSTPVGFKNGTDGNTRLAMDAVAAARTCHFFPSVTRDGELAIFQTEGNDTCHVVLRGGAKSGPNYEVRHIDEVATELRRRGLPPRVMVDCSHDNSGRDHRRQGLVAGAVIDQIRDGSEQILGIMLESHLVEGRQDFHVDRPLAHGQSITDACIGFEETEMLLERLADARLDARRRWALTAGGGATAPHTAASTCLEAR